MVTVFGDTLSPPVQDLKAFISSGLVPPTAVPPCRYSASPPAEGLRSPGTSQRLLETQGFSQVSTPRSPLQPPTWAGNSSTGKPSPGHYMQGDAKHTAASPGELCARCLVIYWDCVHKNKIEKEQGECWKLGAKHIFYKALYQHSYSDPRTYLCHIKKLLPARTSGRI